MSSSDARNAIADILTGKFHFSQGHARRAAERMTRQPAVQAAFLTWVGNRSEYPPLTAEGFSVERLVREYRMEVPGALLTLAWLLEDPEEARAALARGYDTLT